MRSRADFGEGEAEGRGAVGVMRGGVGGSLLDAGFEEVDWLEEDGGGYAGGEAG